MARSMYVAEPFPSFAFFCALRADALGHVVYCLNLKTVRVGYSGYGSILKAERAVAYIAMEMNVTVIINIAVSVAQFIAYSLAAVINLMQQMVLLEKHQRAEYAGLVNGVNLVLQFSHSDGLMTLCQRLQNQQPVSCGLDPVLR